MGTPVYSAVSLQDARVFVEAATTLNVSQAARNLSISQPSASYSLDKFRRSFNDQLLVRVGRDLHLTPMGKDLLNYWRPALKTLDGLVRQTSFEPSTARNTFGLIGPVLDLSSPRGSFLRNMMSKAPHAGLRTMGLSTQNIDDLLHGEFHLYFGPKRAQDVSGIQSQSVGDFECLMYYCDQQVTPPKSLESFLNCDFVQIQLFDGHTGIIDDYLNTVLRKRRHLKYYAGDFGTIRRILQSSPVFLTLSSLLVQSQYGDLDIAPIPFDAPLMEYELRWSETKSTDACMIWLREQVLDFLKDAPRTFAEAQTHQGRMQLVQGHKSG